MKLICNSCKSTISESDVGTDMRESPNDGGLVECWTCKERENERERERDMAMERIDYGDYD